MSHLGAMVHYEYYLLLSLVVGVVERNHGQQLVETTERAIATRATIDGTSSSWSMIEQLFVVLCCSDEI